MRGLVFVGSHMGYPMDRTPLGGGAMVGLQLARAWAAQGAPIAAIGSGRELPWPEGSAPDGSSYVRLPREEKDLDLVRLTERGYAGFCRRFEAASTAYVLEKFDPRRIAVVVNDISEGPDLERLSAAGFRIVSIWHVDVVDYFNRMYLRGALAPERLTKAYTWLESRGLRRAVPDLLRLVFDKQESAVRRSARIVVPSRPMAETLGRCYGHLGGSPTARERTLVVPWGGWPEPAAGTDVRGRAGRLKEHYQIGPRTRVLATLSRISPEKGIHILLGALRDLESSAPEIEDLCVFVCGEPAFMRGEAYARKIRAAAGTLRRFRAFFPGYLAAPDKRAYLALAEIFVSPSVHESYGLTLVEAMRAGLPVLASDHHGSTEILRPEFGAVVPYGGPGREARMAAALRELLAGGRLPAMGAAARAAAQGMSFERAAAAIRAAAEADG